MKENKVIRAVILILIIMVFTGCGITSSTRTNTYIVKDINDNKVKINVILNTLGGYKLSVDSPFEIKKDGETLSYGKFIYAEYYDDFLEEVENNDKTEILDKGEEENYEYIFYNYDNSEYDYVILIKDSGIAVILANAESEKNAKEIFERLSFEKG